MKKLLLILVVFLLLGVACTKNLNNDIKYLDWEGPVPQEIAMKVNNKVRAIVGDDFFDNNIIYHPEVSKTIKYDYNCKSTIEECMKGVYKSPQFTTNYPYYRMRYDIEIANFPEIENNVIFIDVDSNMNILREYFPHCAEQEGLCTDFISEEDAMYFAYSEGFDTSKAGKRLRFQWNNRQGDFVWIITNTLKSESGTYGGGKYKYTSDSGKTISISANTGELISIEDWSIDAP